jgi:hypothetical protein
MIQHIIQFIDLLTYAFVASQAMFYLLAMSKAVKKMRPGSFIELGNLLDAGLQVTLRLVYYLLLFTSLLWCYVTIKSHSQTLIITSFLALLAQLMDINFLLKGNQPINKVINTWNAAHFPDNWEDYRKKWFIYYHRRQIAGLIGFSSLLAGAVFR